MKIRFLKSTVLKNRRRGVVVLLSLACLILVAFTPGASQLRNQKRITALQLGDAAEGARVTIVSDSALNDYEAFRRGDRFYVKIPLADFTSIPPQLRADGFEDVQVQKVGDGVIVSFRLQPGASAHVDQHANRLDVIFSAPNRSLRNGTANASSRVPPGGSYSRSATDRTNDAAGPIPPGSSFAYPPAGTYSSGELNSGPAQRNPRLPYNPSANANNNAGNQPNTGYNAVKSPSPASSPSSSASPSASPYYPPVTSVTPYVSASPQPAVGQTAAGTVNWKTRTSKWISANRLATLLGALILLCLIIYLLLLVSRRRKDQAKQKRLQAPKVQPKVQTDVDTLAEPVRPSAADLYERPAAASSMRSPTAPVSSPQPRVYSNEPAIAAGAVASAQNRPSVLTKPSISSPTAAPGEVSSEEQEREVFEL